MQRPSVKNILEINPFRGKSILESNFSASEYCIQSEINFLLSNVFAG